MQRQANYRMGRAEWALLIFLSMLWGGSFFLIEVALEELRPFSLVFGRVALAALFLHLILRVSGQRFSRSRELWRAFLVLGTLNNVVPFSLIIWGQTQIAGGLAAILNATTPLWTIILAHIYTSDERLTPNRLLGILFGLGGVILLIGPNVLVGLGANVLAQLAVVLAALSYAVAGIYGKRLRGTPPLVTAAGQLTVSSLMMLPIFLLIDQPWRYALPQPATLGALLALVILSTVVAYLIYFRLLATVGATNLLLVTFLIPVSALLLGITLLGERFGPLELGGMALIGAGLLAVDGRVLGVLSAAGRRAASSISPGG